MSPTNFDTAWKQVRRKKGDPGVDGITMEDYLQWAKQHWAAARRALERGYYVPQPVQRVTILKPTGGFRLLGVPTVNDRVDHDLLMNRLRLSIADNRILKLVGRYLRAGGMIEGQRHSILVDIHHLGDA
ncbi:MAG TPA: hypothetical protein ENI97_10695 [Gammaproteobacteria bacterium]|nr:hypothetical protein [Gammaproteobacteria bacterium]